MPSADVRVAPAIRTITLDVDPAEALRGLDYLNRARVHDDDTPYSIDLLRGALSAVANNKEYGGH